jgi:hypothetical protein
MTMTEIGYTWGLSVQRISQLMVTEDFPAPFRNERYGRLWFKPDIEAYARANGRRVS